MLARAVHLQRCMNSSKVLGFACLTAVIGWSGFSIADKVYTKLPVGSRALQQAALTVASVTKAKAGPIPMRSSVPELIVPDPGLADTGMLADPTPVTPAAGPAPIAPAAAAVAAAEPASPKKKGEVEFEETDLLAAVQQGIIQATLRGNGRDRMTAQLRNNSPTPLRISVTLGQLLEGGRNRVVVTRSATAELLPARTVELKLVTAALHSANMVGDAPYKLSYHNAERVDGFLKWASEHGGLSAPAMQVVVLALTENLPLQALAKFSASKPGEHNTDAFRAETADLLAALTALRDCGAKMDTFTVANDPQLRIESMIEPLSREAAKRYYGITEGNEWDFWKHELLEGSPSTRHYALYGIARFYPDVALEMLPKWARETGTHPVYRLAAVQALGDTQRPEALPILRTLAGELGATTELGKAATQSATYLDKRLTELGTRPQVIAFRDKSRVTGL